mmetsp:Transcript_110264/g.235484  ORF Transcript_110264/g.235484 Transcript_110264/m.235484 type:complete len:219 (+) Transcript_110264:389-1045(+)
MKQKCRQGDLRHVLQRIQRTRFLQERCHQLGHRATYLLHHGQVQQAHEARLHHESARGELIVASSGSEVHSTSRAEAAPMDYKAHLLRLQTAILSEDAWHRAKKSLGIRTEASQRRPSTAPGVAPELGAEHGLETAFVEGAHIRLEICTKLGVRVEVHEHWNLRIATGRLAPGRRGVEAISDWGAVSSTEGAVAPAAARATQARLGLALPRVEGDVEY